MKILFNLILVAIAILMGYFLWSYMQESATPQLKPVPQKGIKLQEREVIQKYIKKPLPQAKVVEQNRSRKRVTITIESVLHKEHNVSALFKKIEHEKNITHQEKSSISKENEGYTIEGVIDISKVKKSPKRREKVQREATTMAQKSLLLRAKKEPLKVALKRVKAKLGDRVFIRIFKESNELEVWIKPKKSRVYKLLKIYSICKYSGGLGPKERTGDKKSPEGFYNVTYSALNPKSSFHLSFNLGFPNSYDRFYGYTGSYLMVHGKCASVGCYAMGDRNIDDIYMLVERALLNGQLSVSVHIFPFRMTKVNLAKHKKSKWYKFWRNLKEGYDAFEKTHVVPKITAVEGVYKVVVRR